MNSGGQMTLPSCTFNPKPETILLTGATGFLGSHLLEALVRDGYKLTIIRRGISNTWRIRHLLSQIAVYDVDRQPLENIFNEQRIDAIIHTACQYGRKAEPMHQVVEANIQLGLKLLDLAIAYNTNIFVNTDTLLQPYLNIYSLSKKQFVEWLRMASTKIQVVNLRVEYMYGPLDDKTKLIPWILEQFRLKSGSVKLTPGDQLRDFIYISDVVSAYLKVLDNLSQFPDYAEFDIGTGKLTSMKVMVESLKYQYERQNGKIPTHLDFGAIPYRDGELMSVKLDNTTLKALDWKAEVSLSMGLEKITGAT
jgi:nucleoside-diphosphate-sugar epimerase